METWKSNNSIPTLKYRGEGSMVEQCFNVLGTCVYYKNKIFKHLKTQARSLKIQIKSVFQIDSDIKHRETKSL